MGHVRLGRLPTTRRWGEVVKLLRLSSSDEAGAVALETLHASERRLRELGGDPSVTYCFWLVTRVASASRAADFTSAVGELGIEVRESDTALGFISRLTRHARSVLARHTESGPFSELASLSMRRALAETVGQEGRSLFGSSVEDLCRAFRRHSTPARLGALAKSFFGDFLARTLRFFVDKELANSIGSGSKLSSIEAGREFSEALDLHARESARIMEEFARDWYSKHHWESQGRISHDEAERFTAHALRKIRSQLRRSELARAAS